MKEIGGYFELECAKNIQYHENGILLNSARNALRYFIQNLGIKKIHVPNYTCPVVWEAICQENCTMIFYDIDNHLMPMVNFSENDWILYTNYFGVCGKNTEKLANQYSHLIVDNAQAFYAIPQGIANLYSPRKFFGVPDGGILVSQKTLPVPLKKDSSFNRCTHLLKRWDLGASSGFSDFQKNDNILASLPTSRMSALTTALLGNIDYEGAKHRRLENFRYVHDKLNKINQLAINLSEDDVPMVYPLLMERDDLRDKLIANKIYIARYWPETESYLQKYLLPLPIDQRYGIKDMERIIHLIEKEGNDDEK
jgi:hypothetical protein